MNSLPVPRSIETRSPRLIGIAGSRQILRDRLIARVRQWILAGFRRPGLDG